jgi:hypothetical protein
LNSHVFGGDHFFRGFVTVAVFLNEKISVEMWAIVPRDLYLTVGPFAGRNPLSNEEKYRQLVIKGIINSVQPTTDRLGADAMSRNY